MKIINCALLYADGDKYVWSVVTESASEFPIDMELVADGSIWENDGVKSVLTDGAWVAESSGGGFDIPTFTVIHGEYSCDMTYEEAKASYIATADSVGMGLAYVPHNGGEGKAWAYDVLSSGDMLSHFDIPETVNEGLALIGAGGSPETLFADDGNFYGLNL